MTDKAKKPKFRRTVEDRFWAKVYKSGSPNGCWVWVGGKTNTNQRSHSRLFNAGDRIVIPHRFLYELENGRIQDNSRLIHSCRNSLCVRPEHLRLVSFQAAQSLAAKSDKSITERFWGKVKKTKACWEWMGAKHAGYGFFRVFSRKRMITAHRFSYELFYGHIPIGACVLHKCDNPICVRPDHLFIGSQADNIADMVSKGRQRGVLGECHPKAKLTDDLVRQIRQEYTQQRSPIPFLAEKYHVSQATIWKVVNKFTWKHVG